MGKYNYRIWHSKKLIPLNHLIIFKNHNNDNNHDEE